MMIKEAYDQMMASGEKMETKLFGRNKKYKIGGFVITQAHDMTGKIIDKSKITKDEAFAAATILHKRAGQKIPLSEEEIISRLKIKPERIKKILKKFKEAAEIYY